MPANNSDAERIYRLWDEALGNKDLEAAFDYVAGVIARKRLGYTFDWRRLSAWTTADWEGWLCADGPKS